MGKNITIAIYPLNITWADKDENLAAVDRIIDKLNPLTDILVLPELFSTGYIQDQIVLEQLSETTSGKTITKIKEWASKANAAIAGSYLFSAGGMMFNRGFFIEPSGEETYYDKRHLFSLSSESQIFAQGSELPPVVRFRGWNIAMIICYDLRFPVWCRNTGHYYDIMLIPANWPVSRRYAWKQLNIARAIENQAIYVGADRSGNDDFGNYDNMAMIVDSLGKPFGMVDDETGIIYGQVDRDILEEQRRKLPFGKDADDFKISLCSDNR